MRPHSPPTRAAPRFISTSGTATTTCTRRARRASPRTTRYIQKAIENYQKAAEKDPKPEMRKLALQYLVAAYGPEKLNEPEKAEPIVQKMIQIEPNEPTNYFALSKIYEDGGRYDEAEQTLLKAKEVKPNDPQVYTTIVRLLQPPGGLRQDDRGLNKAADLEPKNPQGYQLLATYYWEKASKDHRLSRPRRRTTSRKGLRRPTRRSRSTPTTPMP